MSRLNTGEWVGDCQSTFVVSQSASREWLVPNEQSNRLAQSSFGWCFW